MASSYDILRPRLIWTDGRCYRVLCNSAQSAVDGNASKYYAEELEYQNDFLYEDGSCDDWDPNICVKEVDGKFQNEYAVPSVCLPHIIGKDRHTLHRIEVETNTTIRVPNRGQSSSLVIIGHAGISVRHARTQLEIMVDRVRQTQDFTHFLSIAMTGSSLQQRFMKFQEQVLETCSESRGISASLFQNPAKLHMTLTMMVLLDEKELNDAAHILQSCRQTIFDDYLHNKPLHVEMHGIDYMNDDPSEVDILFGKVRAVSPTADCLQSIAGILFDKFSWAATANRRYKQPQLKLHVTLMNSLFSMRDTDQGSGNRSDRQTFDARNILKQFSNFNFGEMEVNEVCLSVRNSYDKDGYYISAGTLSLVSDDV